MPDILLCTLGVSWAVVPEVAAFIDPEQFDLFANHPRRDGFSAQLGTGSPGWIDEIWIATTGGENAVQSTRSLFRWWELTGKSCRLRVWRARGTDQLASEDECLLMRELLFRATLLASEKRGRGHLWLSLAGGRKTMSADLQRAGQVIGCDALLHVVDDSQLPGVLRTANPGSLNAPLPAADAVHVFPLVVGRGVRSELLDVKTGDRGPVSSERFPLALAEPGAVCEWHPGEGETLLAGEIAERETEGGRLLGNYLHGLARKEFHENWRLLYRLPPRRIEALRHTRLEERHLPWLRRLPKADLHRHLGGCLSLVAQKIVAQAVWDAMDQQEREWSMAGVDDLLGQREWPWDWPDELKRLAGNGYRQRAFLSATLLLHSSDEQLQRNLFDATGDRVGLGEDDFSRYERPGELTGSAILGAHEAIEPYAWALVKQAMEEGLAYVELRGSPNKYDTDGMRFIRRLFKGLDAALQDIPEPGRPLFRFILIADRRVAGKVPDVVELAVRAQSELGSQVAGIDLAGDEGTGDPDELSSLFRPAFEQCLPVTIHAGEGQDPANIWKAAYSLHADRVGHGLTLGERPQLRDRFRDRRICIELCPTSNLEVEGYFHPVKAPGITRVYPLSEYWARGVPVTVCTDNPGISRTDLANEYLEASRMTEGGLRLWDVLAMVKQGFAHAFLPAPEKEALMKRVDEQVYRLLVDTDPGVNGAP